MYFRYNLAELLAAVPPILGAEELKISIGMHLYIYKVQ